MRLKASASFADAGDIHETVKKLLAGTGDRKQLIEKVRIFWMLLTFANYCFNNRRPSY